jgi:RNA polymerase sigma-70 factor (ECF subfamily)
MDREFGTATSPTLLARLAQVPMDQAAWEQFVDRYGGRIYRWCRHWRLQDADARDVTQNVLVILAQRLQTFTYDPTHSFRNWLCTVTRHAWAQYVENQQRFSSGSGDRDVQNWLQTVETREDLIQNLEKEFDRDLLEEAMRRVQLRVQPRTWEAFQLLAFDGRSGAEAAAQLGMKVATVFVARSKVQKYLQVELSRLEGHHPHGK